MADCPIIGNDGVYGQVTTVMNNMWGNSQVAFVKAIEALSDLGEFRLDLLPVNVHFNARSDWWAMRRPESPADPDIEWDPDFGLVPTPPNGDLGAGPVFQQPPTFTGQMPSTPVRTPPTGLTATPPVGPPALEPIVIPTPPNPQLPEFPELRDIVLPDPPSITLPTFQGVRPSFSIPEPVNTFGFNAEQYSSPLLTALRNRIQVMIGGAPGLPAAAAAAMRSRATEAVDAEGLRMVQEVTEQFGARGFPQPNGVLNRAIREQLQKNQSERNALSRDIYLEDVKNAIEDMRFAVAQGVALESNLMANFLGVQQLALDAAKATVTIAIDVMNARIALANLELSAYQTDAQVHRDLIQAELAKIEVYRAELEGKKLIGELNAQDVEIFAQRVRFVLSQVEIYNARVNGVRAVADVNISKVQAFAETVKAYEAQVEAKRTEWEIYGKQLEADLLPYRRYELETEIFGRRIDIWRGTNQNLIDQRRLRIDERELDVTAFRARLESIGTVLTAESQRVDALVRRFAARVEKYRADAALEQVVSEGNARPFQLAIEQERSRVDTELKNAELRINETLKRAEILVSTKQAIGQIGSTLSAGLASAMSVHASLSSGLNQSTSCNTDIRYTIDS